MSDNKVRCALIFRLAQGGDTPTTLLLASHDHAAKYETHQGRDATVFDGNRDQSFAQALGALIQSDPPSALTESGVIGGFKFVQSDQHQVIYGADGDGVCEFFF